MAQFFKPQKKSTQPQRIEFTIDSLDHHCVGVGRHQGKAIFVEGALPGELIKARIVDDKKHYAHAALQQIVTPAANRIDPFCPHYRECGGCSAQHLGEADQQAVKEAGLVSEANLEVALDQAALTVIVTAHDETDIDQVVGRSELVLDLRGVTRGYETGSITRL